MPGHTGKGENRYHHTHHARRKAGFEEREK